MELTDYLRIMRQRWVTIVLVILVAVAASAAITWQMTPQYESTARLFITTPQSEANEAYQGGMFSQQRVKSYVNLLSGEAMAQRVKSELDLDESTRSLSDQVDANSEPDTVVLTVSITDPDPERAQLLTQTYADQFVDYVKELETPEGKSTAPIKATVVDKATAPPDPVSPQPMRNIGLALVLGLLLGIGLAVLREVLDTSIKSREGLLQASNNAPVLGGVQFDKSFDAYPLISSLSSHSPRREAFRVLRTNLQFVNIDASSRTFVLTSAVPEEGKSSTAVNLGLALAESGKRVIMVGADLRRPKIAEYLQLESSVGVTTVLIGRVELADAIQNVGDNFDVLAGGLRRPIPPNFCSRIPWPGCWTRWLLNMTSSWSTRRRCCPWPMPRCLPHMRGER